MPLSLHSYLLFIASVAVLCIVPGPDMAYMLGRTVTQGKRAGLVAAVGINLGGYAHVAAAVLGLSAIVTASSAALTAVKIVGAAYLIWIGVRSFAAASPDLSKLDARVPPASLRRVFWEGFLSDALNPKVSMFFLAFLPQFVEPAATTPVPFQLLFLGVICNVVALSINVTLVMWASGMSARLRSRASVRMWLNRLLGGLFVALGLRIAAEKL